MINDRVENTLNTDISHEQFAQKRRTEFTPGKISSRPGDENWPKDFRVPVGTPVFKEDIWGSATRSSGRVSLIGRNIICDDTVNPDVTNIFEAERRTGYEIAGSTVSSSSSSCSSGSSISSSSSSVSSVSSSSSSVSSVSSVSSSSSVSSTSSSSVSSVSSVSSSVSSASSSVSSASSVPMMIKRKILKKFGLSR